MLRARLNAAFGLWGDGTNSVFSIDLNAVIISVSNGSGGASFSAVLPRLLPDVIIDATASSGTVVAVLNKNEITVTLSPPPASGTQVNISIGLGFNSD